ncbi:MAG: hypothetical protein K6G63_00090 [Eubacterium sp.]|nr:hypothetical protein [Eubacterium sp.]
MKKRIIKYVIVFCVLGVCGLFTYRFLTSEFTQKESGVHGAGNVNSTTDTTNAYQTAAPDEIKRKEKGWERIKYVYLPALKNIKLTDPQKKRQIQGIEFSVLDAEITHKWNPNWNYGAIRSTELFNDQKMLKKDKSFLSVTLKMKNTTNKEMEYYVNAAGLMIYDKNGKCIDGHEIQTASFNKPVTKSFYRLMMEENKEYTVDIVYIIDSKSISDKYYYFIDIVPNDVYPSSIEEFGLFKLPLGVERTGKNESNKE